MSTTRRVLEGACVLITRPRGRGDDFAAAIRRLGGRAACFPVIETRLNDCTDLLNPGGIPLHRHSLCIFVSVPAVEAIAAVLSSGRDFPADLPVAAVGPATACALEDIGIAVSYLPDSADSEGLLECLSAAPLADRDVALFRGQQGRKLLEQSLATRGARLHPVECYRREPIRQLRTDVLSEWLENDLGILTLTSVEILDAFLAAITAAQRDRALVRPVAVLSDRIAAACRDRGFSGPVAVTPDVGLDAMLDTVIRLHIDQSSHDH